MLRIGQTLSDARLRTTAGSFGVHEYFGGSWGLFVCYVADFSPVCADELRWLVNAFHEFESRNVKVLGMSCDSVESHINWIEDIKEIMEIESAKPFPFPIVSDCNRILSLYLNILDAKSINEDGLPLPCRATFVIAPDMTIQLIHFYPQTIGRNFDEILRSIDALQLTFEYNNDLFTPCGWKPKSDRLMMSPKMSKEDREERFPNSTPKKMPSGKDYVHIVSRIEICKNYKK